MASTNTGSAIRWANGGILRVIIDPSGTPVEHEFLLVDNGSLNWQAGLREGIIITDRSDLVDVRSGDKRPSSISFSTQLGHTTFQTLLALMRPADTAGSKTRFTVEIEYSVASGTPTSHGVRFANCWMQDGETYSGGGPGAVDSVSFSLQSLDTEPTMYTPDHD